jgi:hypothetical protein
MSTKHLKILVLCLLTAQICAHCQPRTDTLATVVQPPLAARPTISALIPLQPDSASYADMLKRIQTQRNALKVGLNDGQIGLDSVRMAFTAAIVASIIPYWYGTHWSFEGHTESPRVGDIACGYFVSTTLLHAGLNLNRYRLAQQNPQTEATMLALGSPVRVIQSDNPDTLLARCERELREGLYFIGLGEGHVGYLYKKQGELISIHADYTSPNICVAAQPFDASIYRAFGTFYIADITWNDRLVRYWLSGSKIELR